MRRVQTDRRTVLKMLAASGGIPWLAPAICRVGRAQDEGLPSTGIAQTAPPAQVVQEDSSATDSSVASADTDTANTSDAQSPGDSDSGSSDVPTIPLFSCIEPSLGDLWGRAAVISQFAIVASRDTRSDSVTLVTCGDDHWLRMWRISLTNAVPVPAVLTEVERIPGKTPPVPEHEPIWVRRGGQDSHEDWIYAVAVTPDGRRMISGDAKGRILFWNFGDTGIPEEPPQILQSRGPAILSATSCSGEFLLVGEQGLVRRYRTAQEAPETFSGAAGTLRSVDASSDGKWFAVCGDLGDCKIYSAQTKRMMGRFATSGRRLRCVRFSPSGTRLIAAGDAGITYLCDLDPANGTLGKSLAFPRQVGKIYSLAWLTDRFIATGASDGKIRILDVESRKAVMRSDAEGHNGTISAMQWLSDSATLLSVGFDTTIRLWRPKLPEAI